MVDAMRLGAWLRSGQGIGWLAAGTSIPNCLHGMPFYYLFLASVFCFCSVFMISLELCRCSSDLFMSSRPRTGLATTYITGYGTIVHDVRGKFCFCPLTAPGC